jgi:ribonuclease HI
MTEWLLFTDGSVNTQTRHGFGASLLVTSDESTHTLDELKTRIKVHEFTETSSTKIELQTLLRALAQVPKSCASLTVYTDSQNILSLLDRRAGFEAQDYHSKKGHLLRNAALYQAFFQMLDQREFKLVKVKGHKSSVSRDAIDHLFNLVDKASRKARRKHGP